MAISEEHEDPLTQHTLVISSGNNPLAEKGLVTAQSHLDNFQEIITIIKSNKNLERLVFRSVGPTDLIPHHLIRLRHALTQNSSLEEIYFGGCAFDEISHEAFPLLVNLLYACTHIKSFFFYRNGLENLTDNQFKKLFYHLLSNRQSITLHVDGEKLSDSKKLILKDYLVDYCKDGSFFSDSYSPEEKQAINETLSSQPKPELCSDLKLKAPSEYSPTMLICLGRHYQKQLSTSNDNLHPSLLKRLGQQILRSLKHDATLPQELETLTYSYLLKQQSSLSLPCASEASDLQQSGFFKDASSTIFFKPSPANEKNWINIIQNAAMEILESYGILAPKHRPKNTSNKNQAIYRLNFANNICEKNNPDLISDENNVTLRMT